MAHDFEQVYRTFFNKGEVTEIRVLGVQQRSSFAWDGVALNGSVFGYFDNEVDFGKAAEALSQMTPPPKGVYFTPNPCKPELLARACNRLVGGTKDRPQTSDRDIAFIRWLLVDLDPKRPSGISSDQVELDRARALGKEVVGFIESVGFAAPVKAVSGNGYHMNYRLPDLPNEPEISGKTSGLIARSLAALADRFKGLGVDVDVTVGNASRIWKLYGTWARKGDNTPDRPHRPSQIFKGSPENLADVAVTPLEILEKLAGMAPASPGKGQQRPPQAPGKTKSLPQDGNLGPLDVERYLAHYGVPVKGTKQEGAATYYLLENCIFDETHTDGKPAVVLSPEKPYLAYACFHQSCKGRTWKDARNLISGTDSVAQFCEGYDPNWKPGKKKRGKKSSQDDEAEPGFVPDLMDWDALPAIPPPKEVDPMIFFDLGPNGTRKRGSFVQMRLAQYLAAYLAPLCWTDGKFYQYRAGVWQVLPVSVINQMIAHSLKDLCKAEHLDSTIKVLGSAINRQEEDWPVHPNLINVKNGMIDLGASWEDLNARSPKVLLPHNPDYGSRVQLPVAWNPDAKCPRWLQFLFEIFPNAKDRALALQLFAGYLLIPSCRYEKAMFLYGTGANGKSTVLNIFEKILGSENVCSVSLSELVRPFSVLALQNKMLSVASEMEAREAQSTEVLKKVISGDLVRGEEKFGRIVEFRTNVKFIFAMNNPPSVTDKTEGFKRKIIVIHFEYRIPDEKMDRGLVDYLLANEKEGILVWMVVGAFLLQKNGGFKLGEAVLKDTDSFMHTLNPLLDFLDERTLEQEDGWVPCDELYQNYREWCNDGGLRSMGKVQFNLQLLGVRAKVSKKKMNVPTGGAVSRRHCYVGIILYTETAE